MTYSHHTRCPTCASEDVYGFQPTPTGQSFYCTACRARWYVTAADRVLDMLAAARVARRLSTGHEPG
jgi:hypothetical protein